MEFLLNFGNFINQLAVSRFQLSVGFFIVREVVTMKLGVHPDVTRITRLLDIMDSHERMMFMEMVEAIEKVVKENHENDEGRKTDKISD